MEGGRFADVEAWYPLAWGVKLLAGGAWAEVVLVVGLGQLSGSITLVGRRAVVMDPHPSCAEVLAVTEESPAHVTCAFGVRARHNSTGCGQECSWGREHVSVHQSAKFGYAVPPSAAVRAACLKLAVLKSRLSQLAPAPSVTAF